MIAIQDTIPWVKKCLQNFLRSSSSAAATCLKEPGLEDLAHLATSKSDIALTSKTIGSIEFLDIEEIIYWYEEQNKKYKLLLDDCSVSELANVPSNAFTNLGLGLKFAGQLL